MLAGLLPLPKWARYDPRDLRADFAAAVAVLFLDVPQGVAYAIIAGLPPAMGLYAAALPTIIAAIFRSTRDVHSGPTNALSLLVGSAVAAHAGSDPMVIATTLALVVGAIQIAAGVLRLGALVDYISSAVVLGYVTGAAVLIGVGQLYATTGTDGARGRIWETVGGWIESLPRAQPIAVAVAIGTLAILLLVRAINRRTGRRIPSAIVAMGSAIAMTVAFDLESHGVRVIADLAPIPIGLPPLTLPALDLVPALISVAAACAVLSLVESNAVARSIAARSGNRIDASTDFFAQGMANATAGLCSGYPVSGSLVRSSLAHRMGARTRVSGVLSGLLVLLVLVLLGPVLDHTPLASLGALLVVLAWDLVDVPRIRSTFRASPADGLALVTTMLGTWVLPLDTAIYLGVAISLAMFLRQARLLTVRELVIGSDGLLHEQPLGVDDEAPPRCPRIRILHFEGSLFFGAASELQAAIDGVCRDPRVGVLIVRVKRARGLDATTVGVLEAAALRMRADGRHLLLVGMNPEMMGVLQRSGAAERIGRDRLFPSQKLWFSALDAARSCAVSLCGGACESCPLANARLSAVGDPGVALR